MSIRIAIVEDDNNYRAQLQSYISRYCSLYEEDIRVTAFSDGFEIASGYNCAFDIILMDIEMAHMDGMEAARRIRRVDRNVVIIFITNLAQYALVGYQVEAFDYVLKPIQFFDFSQELRRAIRKVSERQTYYLRVAQEGSIVRLDISTITYLESQGNNILYHTTEKVYIARGTLKGLEQQLTGRHFSRCNNCYLVNLAHVEKVDKLIVTVAGKDLQISRPRRKAFMEDMAVYIGES